MYPIINEDLFGIPAATANMVANGLAAIVAIFVVIALYRLFTRPRMASGRRSKNARLAITDAASIDDRRRLVLVRRDDVEHLIMIGGPGDLVIESDIRKSAPARSAARPSTPSSTAPSPASPSTSPKQAPSKPEPARAAPSTSASASPEPKSEPGSAPSTSKPATASAPEIKTSPPPTAKTAETGKPDTSSLIGSVTKKPDLSDPARKSSVGDNMDALLNEITPKK